ncbi:hypothetical protein QAD02_018059 [Eretmocerus hayati]|uniref:Uncharacterized protein n=1 Tax=Eretmocerus hayati TaxID=131215 RepID=A0ACC2PG03_9HYME|nr:hypothetical protein QAD02_018059 [Eretmocerus hayati]
MTIPNITNSTTLCSDHFERSCFEDGWLDGYTTVRRLKANAVPTILNPVDTSSDEKKDDVSEDLPLMEQIPDHNSNDVSIVKAETIPCEECSPSQITIKKAIVLDGTAPNPLSALKGLSPSSLCLNEKNELFCLNVHEILRQEPKIYLPTDECSSEISTTNNQEMVMIESSNAGNAFENSKENHDSSVVTNNSDFDDSLLYSDADIGSCEESLSCDNKGIEMEKKSKRNESTNKSGHIAPPEKIRFKDGFRYHTLSRRDFTSDEAFQTFLIYHRIRTSQEKAILKRLRRRDKKISVLKELVNTLVTQDEN